MSGRAGGAPRRVVRLLAWPVRRYFGTQFDWTRAQVVDADHRLHQKLDQLADRMEDRARDEQRVATDALRDDLAQLRHDVAELRGAVAMSALSGAEALADVGHELRLLGEGVSPEPGGGANGRAGQAVAVAYAARALAGLAPGARVLVLGPEAAPALALAALGYRVTALGARASEPTHPGVVAVGEGLERWRAPREPFDAVVAIDTIAHRDDADRPGRAWARAEALSRLRALTRPGGPLVLAVGSTGEASDPALAPAGWTPEDRTEVPPSDASAGWPGAGGEALLLVAARAAAVEPG